MRLFLTPGTQICLDMTEQGILVRTGAMSTAWTWSNISSLSARGPNEPVYKKNWLDETQVALIFGRRKKVSYSFLAIGLMSGEEPIFQVDGMLRSEFEALLDSHAG